MGDTSESNAVPNVLQDVLFGEQPVSMGALLVALGKTKPRPLKTVNVLLFFVQS
jgi:hypothetical protein